MQLLTKAIRKALPELGATEGEGGGARIVVKFFDPCGSWTWFATEFDGEDTFFGMVHGHEKELGYFSLKEIEGFKGRLGIGIERDLNYRGHTLSDVM